MHYTFRNQVILVLKHLFCMVQILTPQKPPGGEYAQVGTLQEVSTFGKVLPICTTQR